MGWTEPEVMRALAPYRNRMQGVKRIYKYPQHRMLGYIAEGDNREYVLENISPEMIPGDVARRLYEELYRH